MSDLKLLLTPPQRQLLRDAAYRLGVREQVIARNAVLAALSDPESLKTTSGSPVAASPELIKSLSALARKLNEATKALDDALEQISEKGARLTDASERKEADERAITPAAGHAIAAEQQRVARGILQSVEGITGGTGEGIGSAEGAAGGTKEAAHRDGGARGGRR